MKETLAMIFMLAAVAAFVCVIIALINPSKVAIKNSDKIRFKTAAIYSFIFSGFIILSISFMPDTPGEIALKETEKKELQVKEKQERDSLNLLAVAKHEADSVLQRKAQIEKGFSAWDGSHIGLEKLIKENMNDADSYENVETRYFDMGDYLVVNCKYRGTNVYGAKVVNFVKAKVDLEGNVIKIIETNP